MKSVFKRCFAISVFLLFNHFGFSQSNDIEITFLGNAGFSMSDGVTHIYFDFPYKSGAYGYMTYNESELDNLKENGIFIFTHKHADHYSKKLLKKINGKVYAKSSRKKISELNKEIPDFNIQAIKTKHRFSTSHYSYLLEWKGIRFFISGDTEHPETIGSIKSIDYAFVPYWILSIAKEKEIEIDTKTKVLYHLYPNQQFAGESPDNFIRFDKQGMRFTVPVE